MWRRVQTTTILVALLVAGPARGQSAPLPPDARLDLVRGPLVTSSRIMGLGGAFVGVGEGIDGIYRNPAALANRVDGATSWLDADVTFDWLFVSSHEIDWDGDGRPLSEALELQAVNFGLVLQLGPLGLGVLTTLYGWSGDGVSVAHIDVLVGAGWAFVDGELVVGAGAAVAALEVATSPETPTSFAGVGGDFGVLWRPRDEDWRLGVRVRTGTSLADEARVVQAARVPWQLAIGGSTFHAADPARRYNPRLRAPVTAPADRRYLLVSSELVLTGATGGQSLEALVGDGLAVGDEHAAARASGRRVSLALHLGAEGEVLHDLLKARVGTYIEPVRVAGRHDLRPHLTGGLEVHLFELLFDWKANFAFDVAPGWNNITVGVGFWK